MTQRDKFQKEWDRLKGERARQRALFASTQRRGHARRAGQIGQKMKWYRDAIERIDAQGPDWKLTWAARFVAPFEGLRTTAYYDSGGVLTIGYGHTGSDVFPGQTISKARALAYLASDLKAASQCVKDSFKRPLSVRQRIAAISFTFNVGCGGLNSSTFLREYNAGNTKAAGDALLMWVKDDSGNTLAGLLRRRRAERWLILHPTRG